MKILLDIQDSKAEFFMELLKNFKFVKKVEPLSPYKAEVVQGIKQAVKEMKLIKKGKLKATPAKDLINEL
ncbi:MAG: hypothetical protein OEW75_00765 [Cyclobacteriaceae bacterium]|nr:hypothetical protein [Cyclobacteriaceae bacterium]